MSYSAGSPEISIPSSPLRPSRLIVTSIGSGRIQLCIANRSFNLDVQGAYAEAWACTWYLSETEPKKYFDYLKRTAATKSFEPYNGPQRLKDFTDTFGSNFELLNAKLLRQVEGVK